MKLVILWICFFILGSFVYSQPVQFSRDPFVEITDMTVFDDPSKPGSKMLIIKLKGIIWDSENPAAVVDVSGVSQIVYENSKIFWLDVSDVSADSILLEGNDKQFMIKLGEEISP